MALMAFFLSLIFSYLKASFAITLHSFSVLVITTPTFLILNNVISSDWAGMVKWAFLIYPVPCVNLIFSFINSPNRRILNSGVFAFELVFVALIFANLIDEIRLFIILMLIIFYAILLILIKHRQNVITLQFLPLVISTIVILVYFFSEPNQYSLSLAIGFFHLGSFFAITFYFKNRIWLVNYQMKGAADDNKRLSHNITRLKTSIDQCKRIIAEKDTELMQLARHANLAELTAGIAHELAQPMTGIKGIAQNMIDDINCEEFDNLQAVSELLKICSLVDKSSSIIDHVRTFSRKSEITMKRIDLNAVVIEAFSLVNNQLKKNSIDLVFMLDENIPLISGDTILLEQLMINIISNAKDAILEKRNIMPDLVGTITVTTTSTSTHAKLSIRDNGSGMSDNIVQKIWSPFFTTKKRHSGTGIGLSISNKILKQHNASVRVDTDAYGTCFEFSFPAYNP